MNDCMNDLSLYGHETIGLLMTFLVILAAGSFLVLWALRDLSDENVDEETRQKAYEYTVFAYGALLPSYVPDIYASKPQYPKDAKSDTAHHAPVPTIIWPELEYDNRENTDLALLNNRRFTTPE